MEALGLWPKRSMPELLLWTWALFCSHPNRTLSLEGVSLDTPDPCPLLLALGFRDWVTPFCSHNLILIRWERKVLMSTDQAVVTAQLCVLTWLWSHLHWSLRCPSPLWPAPHGRVITVSLAEGICQSSEGGLMVRLICWPPNPKEYKFIKSLAQCVAQRSDSVQASPLPSSFDFSLKELMGRWGEEDVGDNVRNDHTSLGADLCCMTSLRELTWEGHAPDRESITGAVLGCWAALPEFTRFFPYVQFF